MCACAGGCGAVQARSHDNVCVDMQEQYKAVAERAKQAKQFKEEFSGFAFE